MNSVELKWNLVEKNMSKEVDRQRSGRYWAGIWLGGIINICGSEKVEGVNGAHELFHAHHFSSIFWKW